MFYIWAGAILVHLALNSHGCSMKIELPQTFIMLQIYHGNLTNRFDKIVAHREDELSTVTNTPVDSSL